MKRALFVCVFLLMYQIAFAASIVTFKNGSKKTFGTLESQGDQYCTYISGGSFCFSKEDVASVTEKEQESPDANVVYSSDIKHRDSPVDVRVPSNQNQNASQTMEMDNARAIEAERSRRAIEEEHARTDKIMEMENARQEAIDRRRESEREADMASHMSSKQWKNYRYQQGLPP